MMSAIDTVFLLIEKARDFNRINEKVITEIKQRYTYRFYREVSDLYNSIISLDIGYIDLFFAKLRCQLAKGHYDSSIALLRKEIEQFISWYCPNKEVIDECFSADVISDIIDEDAKAQFGLKLHFAYQELDKAREDEKIAHNLARAYGSRTYGGRTDKDFTKEDWDYVQGTLNDFKVHFHCDNVDLPKMYDDYPSVYKQKLAKASGAIASIEKQMTEYRYSLNDVYVEDVYVLLNDFYSSLLPYVGLGHDLEQTQAHVAVPRPKGGKERFGHYNSLEECIPDEEAFSRIVALVNDYHANNGKMDYIFARRLMDIIKIKNLLHVKKCTYSHFGDLLKSFFPDMFSFETGKALYDAKGIRAPEIDEFIQIGLTKNES